MYQIFTAALVFFDFISSKLIILQPTELKNLINEEYDPGSIQFSISLFGDVLYN